MKPRRRISRVATSAGPPARASIPLGSGGRRGARRVAVRVQHKGDLGVPQLSGQPRGGR